MIDDPNHISADARRPAPQLAAGRALAVLVLVALAAAACAAPPAATSTSTSGGLQPVAIASTPVPTRPPATYVASTPTPGPAAGSAVGDGGVAAVPAGAGDKPEPRRGFLAPDFELETLDGAKLRLSDLRGKAVFINFWATWCGPCKVEMPDIEQVYQKYRERDLVVLGVDVQEPRDKVQEFVRAGGYSWTMLLDKSGEVQRTYRVTGIPSSFFVDRDGVIRDVVIGYTNRTVMEAKLAPLLGGS